MRKLRRKLGFWLLGVDGSRQPTFETTMAWPSGVTWVRR